MASDIRVIRQFDTVRTGSGGRREDIVRIEFNVAEDGPFTIEVPRSEFSAARARQMMETKAAEVRGVRGEE